MVLLTLALVSCSIVLAVIYVVKNLKTSPQLKSLLINSEWKLLELPPGPRPLPILGNMHLLGKYEVPFQAFNDLKEIYGDIFQLTLGSFQCIVVNNYQLIKEVLITKGAIFGGRPDFKRFHKLFGDDRSNSLAFCDWSYVQETRRKLARRFCSPKTASKNCDLLYTVGFHEAQLFLDELNHELEESPVVDIKPLVMRACANMFTQYMCSKRFAYQDKDFQRMVRNFDEIFWDVNHGYAVDFLPWLLPLYKGHMSKLSGWAQDIREFLLANIVDERAARINATKDPEAEDFTDALLIHLKEDPVLTWEHVMFELEDFIGGHSAVGNLVMLCLVNIIKHEEVAAKIRSELDRVTGRSRNVDLFDKPRLPYTEATIFETLRVASSPIVPHVATEDTELAGYAVPKNTVVFVNNLDFNLSEEYWEDAAAFKPERFINDKGEVVKPAHFIPFSTGKRTCIGQKLVLGFSFILLASIVQHFDIGPSPTRPPKAIPGMVALPPETFSLTFVPRSGAQSN
nr:PREDICTED: cytochrome P450 307a1-like [Bemisia tabaci]